MKKLLFLYLAVCALAFAQGVRYDPVPVLTTASNVPPGAMAPVLAIGGSSIHVCSFPANAVPCTNYATTYTDVTLNTACSNSAQITMPGSTTCVPTTDTGGNFGFWVFPGEYSYTVTIPSGQSFGPYPIMTLNNGSQLSYLEGATGSVPRTVTNRLQDYMSVKDFGAKGDGTTDDTASIQAALNAVCSVSVWPNKGGDLLFPPGTYKITATIGPTSACEGVNIHGPSNSEITGIGVHISWAGASGGTVWSNYGLGWSKIHDLHIDGNGTAGVGFLVYADTVSPFIRSSQKNDFFHIYVKGVQGTPGYCVQVGRAGHGDDVSQSWYHLMSLDFCNVGVYQDGSQTVENLFEFNTFGSTIATYGMQFQGGDVHLKDNLFIGGGPATKIANIYIGSSALRADLYANYYEDQGSLDPTVFRNYLFADGANPNRPFSTKIDSDRVEWVLKGGKVLDYEQAGPITVINPTGDDINQPNDPGMYYVNSGNSIQTVYAKFSGGFLATPSQTIAIGDNVVMTSDNPGNQMMANAFEGRDASITSGSATLTIGATNSFTSSMVGYVCYVSGYLSGGTAQQNTITAFTDATHVTLSSAATATGSSLYYRCGRLVNAGQANTTVSDTVTMASNVVEGQIPQYQLRRFLFGTAWQNWSWRADSSGSHIGLMSKDNPGSATYSDFFTLTPTVTGGTTASSVHFPLPISVGGTGHQLFGYFYQDFASVPFGNIPSMAAVSNTVTVTIDTLTGADGCIALSGHGSGIISDCTIGSSNTAIITFFNATGSTIGVGSPTVRLAFIKNSYTGP